MSGQSEDHTTACLPLASSGALVTAVRVCEEGRRGTLKYPRSLIITEEITKLKRRFSLPS